MTVPKGVHPAVRLLDLLASTQRPFVVLHREADIAGGRVETDVDIAVVDDADRVTALLAVLAEDADLHCISVWPYDVGTMASFWIDSAALECCDQIGPEVFGRRRQYAVGSRVQIARVACREDDP